MTSGTSPHPKSGNLSTFQRLFFPAALRGIQLLAVGLVLALQMGCETLPATPPAGTAPVATAAPAQMGSATSEETSVLKEGDVLKVGFPGVPSMDVTQPIRADGKISVPMGGDIVVAGKSLDALTKELLELYSDKLVSKEVIVSLVSSSYPIYVTGAVLRPGKIVAERRLTVFDAIMEAGGFDKAKADLRAVTVVRQENGQNHSYKVNVQKMFSGATSEPFFLKPFDTVYVPEKFNWL